jgi:hypothetical protein
VSADPAAEFSLGNDSRRWGLPKGAPATFETRDLYLGQGSNPLEIAVASSGKEPSAGEVKSLWERRQGKRASPVLCVVLYPRNRIWRAAVCGPTGDDPRVIAELDLGQVARVCSAALEEPDRHAATRFLVETLPEDEADLAGLRNVGMFATHHLRSGVPQRRDWKRASGEGAQLLELSDRSLIEGLGYTIERRDTATALLRVDGGARAIAVFLQESESPDGPGKRYGGISPASHALAAADREGLPYAVVTRGRQIRVYATGSDMGVGRKGRTETFVEANLAVLPDEAAGYLPLIFGARALRAGGSFEEILERSRDFATGLGERLRDRVYEEAVPELAAAVAARHRDGEEPDLDSLYEQTLVILFRLLFVAYAEDKDLLPYRSNGEYSRHALKTMARELGDRLTEGRGEFDPKATDLWADVIQLFRAIELGNEDWQVPRYNGSLFSSEAEISTAGAAIAELELSNAEVGPALTALLVDESAEGTYGPVDFRSLSVREFGTIYEGLLESDLAVAGQNLTIARDGTYVPASGDDGVEVPEGAIYLHNRSGARKATGSYFTKPFAVEHLLDHALEPALNAHLARLKDLVDEGNAAAAGEAFFDFRCADIAMGSGHFLVAAVDRIEARLSSFLAEHDVPAVTAELERLRKSAESALGDLATGIEIELSSLLRRQVARRCIYGVDRNLIAVELARLAIWIHTFIPGLPLGFLDRTLVCGDSLTGIGTLEEAIGVLDPSAASADTPSLYRERIEELVGRTTDALSRLARASDADAAEIRAAREAVAEAGEAAQPARQLFDLLVAIRLGKAKPIEEIDERVVAEAAQSADAAGLAAELLSLHFPLVFPEVFLRERPGFDCILGNPPWEKVKIETHGWWALRFPGLRSMRVSEQNREIEKLRAQRPDLEREFEADLRGTEAARKLLIDGPYPGLGSGDPDLFQAFAWRFWYLVREDGAIGVVLPRSALSATGSTQWREMVLDRGAFGNVTLLLNNRHWIFPEVHAQYTIGLLGLRKGRHHAGQIKMRGPYRSLASYRDGVESEGVASFETEDLRSWATGSAFPMLPSTRSADVFLKLQSHPRFDEPGRAWRARPATELHATGDKKEMILEAADHTGLWPVYKGASFELWNPDTGNYYAWADPEHIAGYLQAKRERGARHRHSFVSEMPVEWVADPHTLPCLHPRIAFRDVARATDTRTFIPALVPARCLLNHTAPFLVWSVGDSPQNTAFALGVLSSIPLDWCARRIVENHITFDILNGLPIPLADGASSGRVARIGGRLAAPDERFATWAEQVGVETGPVGDEERADMIAELDALVAHLYGLDRDDVQHIFETFHEGWDYSARLEGVLAHFDDLAR